MSVFESPTTRSERYTIAAIVRDRGPWSNEQKIAQWLAAGHTVVGTSGTVCGTRDTVRVFEVAEARTSKRGDLQLRPAGEKKFVVAHGAVTLATLNADYDQ